MIVLTGDRPTGALHLGHWTGSLESRVNLQHTNDLLVIVADTQVLNGNLNKMPNIRANTLAVVRDYLAVGLDPNKCTIFLQSQIAELWELTGILSNIANIREIQRLPTIQKELELYGSDSMGFFNYPVSQTADILLFGTQMVPVGSDQLPIVHYANDLAERSNRIFGTDFCKVEIKLSSKPRLLGLDGQHKMSKSLGNAIFLTDNRDVVWQKVHSMYTDCDHIRVNDPGKIEGNVVFDHLDVFHADKDHLEELKRHYQRGGLGDMVLKRILYDDLLTFLQPIWDKNREITDDYAWDVLAQGTKSAQQRASSMMIRIRQAVFNYQ